MRRLAASHHSKRYFLLKSGINPYSASLSKVVAALNTRRGNYSSAESIAEVIFTAATDGTGQVMYLAGQDAEQAYSLRLSLSEPKRLEMVRQHSGL